MYLWVKRRMNRWAAVAGCALAVTAAAASGNANDLCGTTVLADLTLEHNLVCTGTALVAGADGVRIDLDGHTITGSGTGAGVLIVGRRGVWVVGGHIENFTAGVQLNNSSGVVVKQMTFVGNGAAAQESELRRNLHSHFHREEEADHPRARWVGELGRRYFA